MCEVGRKVGILERLSVVIRGSSMAMTLTVLAAAAIIIIVVVEATAPAPAITVAGGGYVDVMQS